MLDPVQFGAAMAAIVKEATAPLADRIAQLEARQLERGEKGDPGKDADPIDIADVVRELVGCAEIVPIVALQAAEAVAKHFEANPVQHGKDGSDGADGKPGERGTDGRKGDPGRDGLDVKDLFRADGGRLVAVLSDGTTKDLGEFVGKDGRDGADGKDGRDGLGFEDCTVEVEDGVATLKFVRGDVVKSVSFPIPEFTHIGFWGPTMTAKAGQFTTHDGHLWMARRDTNETPNYQAKDWQLAARKGADGARGPAGKDYKPREPVKIKDAGND